jgi:hypothetical protein
MKKVLLTIKILFLIILFLPVTNLSSQAKLSVGFYIGGGIINSNSPDLGSFTSSIFIEGAPLCSEYFNTRLSFIYAGDFDIIIPGSRQNYFPFIKGFSVKGILSQVINEPYYLEEGAGILIINNRTFSSLSEWNYGITFSLLAGINLRRLNASGVKLGVGTEFGLTFNESLPRFFSLHLQFQYLF